MNLNRECEIMNSHNGKVTSINKTVDNKIVISSGADGTLFVYKVSEVPNSRIGKFSKKTKERVEEMAREIKKTMAAGELLNPQQRESMISASKMGSSLEQGSIDALKEEGEGQEPTQAQEQVSESDDSDMDE